MPVAVAMLIRVVVQAIVQTGIFFVASALLSSLIDGAKNAVKSAFNMTEQEAEDTIANEIIDALAMVGIIGLGIKSKLPTIVAERLGFTSRGYVKRVVSAKLPASVVGAGAKASVVKTLAQPEAVAQMTVIATKKGISFDTVSKVANVIVATLGVPVGVGLLITNTIDFAAWNSSAYQQSFQKFLAIFGLEPDKDSRSPRTTSQDIFNKIYYALQGQGASSINDPYKQTIVAFSRDNLLDLSDKLAGSILIEAGEVKSKTLLAAILPFISFANKPATTTTTTTSQTVSQATTTPKIQVFSGVVSQGVLGNGTVFTPRSNDMIDDVAELIDSCSINLANFLASLTSRVTYEIKIVSSITTKDGFTQRGSTTQIQTGSYSNGAPKYKKITNKFAVLYLYLLTDKGTRTKLATVNVGPVNSVNFQPDSNDLNAVAGRLQSIVTTNDTSVIQTIISDKPVVIAPTVSVLPPLPNYNTSKKNDGDLGFAFYKRINPDPQPPTYVAVPDYQFHDPNFSKITEEEYRRGTNDTKDYTNSGYSIVNGVFTMYKAIPVVTTYNTTSNGTATSSPPAQRMGANALTLNEWYIANGKVLPTIQARSLLYEQYGLGASALYIGTAEQNIRLLDKLKSA